MRWALFKEGPRMEERVVFVELFHKLEMKLILKRMEQGVFGDFYYFNIWYSPRKC